MPYARILFDVAAYRTAAGDMDSSVKGEVVELTQGEFDRLLDLGAVEKATAKDAKDAEKAAETPDPGDFITPAQAPAGYGKHDQDA